MVTTPLPPSFFEFLALMEIGFAAPNCRFLIKRTTSHYYEIKVLYLTQLIESIFSVDFNLNKEENESNKILLPLTTPCGALERREFE